MLPAEGSPPPGGGEGSVNRGSGPSSKTHRPPRQMSDDELDQDCADEDWEELPFKRSKDTPEQLPADQPQGNPVQHHDAENHHQQQQQVQQWPTQSNSLPAAAAAVADVADTGGSETEGDGGISTSDQDSEQEPPHSPEPPESEAVPPTAPQQQPLNHAARIKPDQPQPRPTAMQPCGPLPGYTMLKQPLGWARSEASMSGIILPPEPKVRRSNAVYVTIPAPPPQLPAAAKRSRAGDAGGKVSGAGTDGPSVNKVPRSKPRHRQAAVAGTAEPSAATGMGGGAGTAGVGVPGNKFNSMDAAGRVLGGQLGVRKRAAPTAAGQQPALQQRHSFNATSSSSAAAAAGGCGAEVPGHNSGTSDSRDAAASRGPLNSANQAAAAAAAPRNYEPPPRLTGAALDAHVGRLLPFGAGRGSATAGRGLRGGRGNLRVRGLTDRLGGVTRARFSGAGRLGSAAGGGRGVPGLLNQRVGAVPQVLNYVQTDTSPAPAAAGGGGGEGSQPPKAWLPGLPYPPFGGSSGGWGSSSSNTEGFGNSASAAAGQGLLASHITQTESGTAKDGPFLGGKPTAGATTATAPPPAAGLVTAGVSAPGDTPGDASVEVTTTIGQQASLPLPGLPLVSVAGGAGSFQSGGGGAGASNSGVPSMAAEHLPASRQGAPAAASGLDNAGLGAWGDGTEGLITSTADGSGGSDGRLIAFPASAAAAAGGEGLLSSYGQVPGWDQDSEGQHWPAAGGCDSAAGGLGPSWGVVPSHPATVDLPGSQDGVPSSAADMDATGQEGWQWETGAGYAAAAAAAMAAAGGNGSAAGGSHTSATGSGDGSSLQAALGLLPQQGGPTPATGQGGSSSGSGPGGGVLGGGTTFAKPSSSSGSNSRKPAGAGVAPIHLGDTTPRWATKADGVRQRRVGNAWMAGISAPTPAAASGGGGGAGGAPTAPAGRYSNVMGASSGAGQPVHKPLVLSAASSGGSASFNGAVAAAAASEDTSQGWGHGGGQGGNGRPPKPAPAASGGGGGRRKVPGLGLGAVKGTPLQQEIDFEQLLGEVGPSGTPAAGLLPPAAAALQVAGVDAAAAGEGQDDPMEVEGEGWVPPQQQQQQQQQDGEQEQGQEQQQQQLQDRRPHRSDRLAFHRLVRAMCGRDPATLTPAALDMFRARAYNTFDHAAASKDGVAKVSKWGSYCWLPEDLVQQLLELLEDLVDWEAAVALPLQELVALLQVPQGWVVGVAVASGQASAVLSVLPAGVKRVLFRAWLGHHFASGALATSGKQPAAGKPAGQAAGQAAGKAAGKPAGKAAGKAASKAVGAWQDKLSIEINDVKRLQADPASVEWDEGTTLVVGHGRLPPTKHGILLRTHLHHLLYAAHVNPTMRSLLCEDVSDPGHLAMAVAAFLAEVAVTCWPGGDVGLVAGAEGGAGPSAAAAAAAGGASSGGAALRLSRADFMQRFAKILRARKPAYLEENSALAVKGLSGKAAAAGGVPASTGRSSKGEASLFRIGMALNPPDQPGI